MTKWTSKKMYDHPVRKEVSGYVELSQADVYYMRAGNTHIAVDNVWAARQHKNELDESRASS